MPMTGGAISAAALALALWVDRRLGEPPARWHPVVGMGAWLSLATDRLAAARPALAFAGGAAWWTLGALLAGGLATGLARVAAMLPVWAAVPLLALALKPMFAWRQLRDEVAAVEDALALSLDAGRARVARLVSRDVRALDAEGVREAAVSTLAENLNDSVVAPWFWFVVAGLPGAVVYRFANTADAMWGYRGRMEWAGKWAARADDLLSWLPARLTALLLCAAAGRALPGPVMRREAACTPSPNGGWPMGTMARLLGVRLRKPGVYALNADGRPAEPEDLRRALRLAGRAVALAAVVAGVALLAPWVAGLRQAPGGFR